ncbi:hypothetical protein LG634_32530 [Streptomyces bambusae]|uniref:hypothetical protein n=1 Tax=Streptomyces bambusae TaxID=1550616 RepID=UPI001CFFBCD5|nr:hypothetical protein [Streptomyces bambusae]MCB5169520.1 hypothetical protein [Streptomyces bambusae]
MNPTLPRQAQAPDEGGHRPAEDRRHVVRRRWLTAVIIVLLIGIPAGYLAISAEQSRDSGRDKAAKVGATQVRAGWPSRVQRGIYQVPVPDWSTSVGYYETNNWRTSRLYVQFTTNPVDLGIFLKAVGSSTEALEPGVCISERDSSVAGWSWAEDRTWKCTTHEQPDPHPTRDVTVDMTDPEQPRVYVVSTVTP